MPSPFPGMDPYIESSEVWEDFHHNLLSAVRGRLNARLPHRFRARSESTVWIEEPATRRRSRALGPDVAIVERRGRGGRTAAVAAVDTPTIIELPTMQRRRHRNVHIVDRHTNRVITVIEVLSPANKKGDDRDAYLTKRNEYLANRVSLVEFDLLRGGRRLPLSRTAPIIADYYVLVCRAWEYPRANIWPFTIRDPFPVVPIPLTDEVPDGSLDLKPCFDRAYDEGTYETDLDYDQPLTPRPRRSDQEWIRRILATLPPTPNS